MSKTQTVLEKALESFRQEYRERFIAIFTNRLNSLKSRLEAAGWDREKVAPYPSSNQGRKTYVQAVKEYNWVRNVTAQKKVEGKSEFYYMSRRPGDPDICEIKQAAWESARTEGIKAADWSIDGYIAKLCGKIGKEATETTYAGRLWDGSVLTVVCEDGEKQVWNTKCILNCSCLGTLFNQWPTRRAS